MVLKLKQKVKASVPEYLIEILEDDLKHFSLPKERLCNEILLKFSLKFRSNYNQEMIFEDKDILQFTLNKDNRKYYEELCQQMEKLNESEIIREIFLSYAVLPPFLRETHLFREKIVFLNTAQKEYRILKIHTSDGVIESRVEKIFRDRLTGYLKIILDSKDYFIGQIRVIS